MKHLRWLLVGALVALAFPATAQVVPNISGNECWQAGQGPGGPGNYLCLNMARNSESTAVVTGTGAVASAMTNQQAVLVWSGAAPTTWTVTLPNTPFDGELVVISTDTTLTTMVTVASGTGATMNQAYAAQTLTANTSVIFRFATSTAKWYRTQ